MELIASKVQDNIRILCYDFGLDTQSVSLVPISDLHIGSVEFDEKALLEFLKLSKENDYYIILNGDIFDCAIKDSRGEVYEATMNPQEALDYAFQIFYPYRERILGIVSGNHSLRISRAVGLDINKNLALLLDLGNIYSDTSIFLHLQLGKDRHGRRFNYLFYIVHGWGTGRTIGGKITSSSQLLLSTNANCYIIGHSHMQNANVSVFNEYDIRTKSIYRKNQFIVHSGCFIRNAKYALRTGLRSNTVGAPIITVSGKRKSIKVNVEAYDEDVFL